MCHFCSFIITWADAFLRKEEAEVNNLEGINLTDNEWITFLASVKEMQRHFGLHVCTEASVK